jgi:pyridoxal 5'-phosphate synthase pdxT subunit
MPRMGVLALQGDFAAHRAVLSRLGAKTREVRHVDELPGLDGLVLPGGESTTFLNLMGDEPWFDALKRFHGAGGRFLATCAGTILLAREVRGPSQESLGLLDAIVERNAFGRQVDSFETELSAPSLGGRVPAVFIRAPRIRWVGPGVEVLARLDGEPVLVRDGRILALTFHPELTGDSTIHRAFIEMAERPETASASPRRAASAR